MDLLVVIFFLMKFVMSQYTNYWDIDAMLQNEEEYTDIVRMADLYLC
jgi:hypothetical protein